MTAEVLSCWSMHDLYVLIAGYGIYGFLSGLLLGWAIWSKYDGK